MNEQRNRMELLKSAPVSKALMDLGLPIMVGMLINALYNLVDAYFVGGLGERQMGAISIVFPLGQVVVGLGLMLGNGAASYLSRLLGQGEKEMANRVAVTSLYGSILLGAMVMIPVMILLEPLLRALGATDTIMPYALVYARIYVVSCLFNVFNVTMNSLTASEGSTKTAMCALLSGALLNTVLDPVLIYGLKLGVAGAAIATAFSQLVSTLVYLIYMVRGNSTYTFQIRDISPTGKMMGEVLKIGIPILAFQVLTSTSIALVNHMAGTYGDAVIAAMGAVTRVVSMGTLVVFGFLKGLQPVAGFSYGAGNFRRLRKVIQVSILWSTLFCAAAGLGMALFSGPVISKFAGGNVEMMAVGTRALTANGLSFLLFGFYTVYSSLFLALGRGRAGFLLGACRQGICFIPAILVLPAVWGLEGVMYAQPVADVVSALIAVGMAVRLHKELAKKENLREREGRDGKASNPPGGLGEKRTV